MDAVRNQPPQTTDDLDADRLQEWMYSAVEGFAGPLQVMRFAGGQSNPTYQVRTPARHYVLRRKLPGRLPASAHAIDREYRGVNARADERRGGKTSVSTCSFRWRAEHYKKK